MMTDRSQFEHIFRWHPATDVTAPKYSKIRLHESSCKGCGVAIMNGGDLADREEIDRRALEFAWAIECLAPHGLEKDQAILFVRLGRSALNEALFLRDKEGDVTSEVIDLCKESAVLFRRARWLANAAIACRRP